MKPLEWEDEQDARVLLAHIDGRVKRDGKHWQSTDFNIADKMMILASAVRFPESIPQATRRGIVLGAIGRVPAGDALTPSRVLVEIQSKTEAYFRQRNQPFVLLSTASLQLPASRLVVRISKSERVVFTRRRPRGYEMPSMLDDEDGRLKAPGGYCAVRVYVSARCELSAYDRALATLDYLRGLWNWCANRVRTNRMSWSVRTPPVNQIVLGPLQTLHRLDGTSASDGYWTEPNFYPVEPSPLLVKDGAIVRKFEREARNVIARVRYVPNFRDSIVRYVRALDDPDMAGSFLKLWGVLEQLLTSRNEVYRKLARRASFVFKDHAYHEAILRQLASARNEIVHRSHTPEEGELLVFQLKTYVETMFQFVAMYPRRFANRDDFLRFLQLPRDKGHLRRRLDMHRFANHFWNK